VYHDTLPATVGGPIAVPSLAAGTDGIAWDALASRMGPSTLYIIGDLNVKGGTVNTSAPNITVYGDVKAEGTIDLAGAALTPGGALVAAGPLTVNRLADFYTGKLDTGSHTVTAGTSVATTYTLAALRGSDGKLVLPQTASAVSIGASATPGFDGNGNVEFTPGTGPVSLANGAVFGNTGTTTFPEGVTLAGTAIFGGEVSIANTKVLTPSTGLITLKGGASLAAGTTSVLINNAGADVTITPTANGKLTFTTADGGKIAQGLTTGGTHTIALTSGNLTLAPNTTYEVVSANGNAGILSLTGNLSLGEGSNLVLTGASTDGAKLTGTGTGGVIANGTKIVGGTNGWQATVGGLVTIEQDSINATGSAVLVAGGASAVITVDAGRTLNIGDTTVITLGSNGSIVLTAHTTTANGGKLSFAPLGTSGIATGGGASGGNTANIANAEKVALDLTSVSGTNKLLTITSNTTGTTHTLQAITAGSSVTLSASTDVI
jgi:hypothetical protein